MTNKTTTKLKWQRTQRTSAPVDAEALIHVELAADAVLDGWTREQVIATLISRLRRDRRYLAYRKACNRRTSYDDEVQQDMRALALAACWLSDGENLAAPDMAALRRAHPGRRARVADEKRNAAGDED